YLPRRPRRRPLAPVAMVALAAALLVVAALLGWGRLRGLAIVVVAVALLSWVCGVAPGQREQIPEGWTRDTPDPDAVRRRVRWLSAAVLTIVGLGCVRAFTPPVFLLSRHVEGSAWSWDVVGLVFGGLLAVGGAIGWHSLLVWLDTRQDPRLEERSDPNPIAGRTLLLVALVVAVVCGAGSDALARAITAVGVLMVGLTVLTLASAEMVRVVESGMPSAPFRAIGLTRTPAVALIAVWLVAASAIDHGGFHDVRVTGTAQRDEPAQPSRTLEGAFTAWKSQGRCPTASVRRPLRPLLLVGASGGGIRAAYWTRTLLGDLTRGTCPRAALFAASGVSGGSLGLVSAQPAGGDDPLAADHVAPTFANMLFVDTPRSLLGFDATDRATRMELSWEHADPSLAKSFTSFPAFPLLFLNGSSVTDGCRFTVGPVEIGAEPPAPIHKQATVAPDCRGLTQYGRGVSAAGGTVDLSDFLCDGQDVRRSTAALLSARFPYISPSGRVTECAHPGRQDARVEYVVDGGYVDRTGAATMLDVWRAIEPLAASDACLAPVYVQLENGYVKVASAPGGARPGELTVPLRAIVQAYQNDTYALGAEARIAFGQSSYHQFAPTSRPGVEAPLGWVLSGSAQRDLDDQRAHVESRPEWRTLRDLLEGRLPCKPR
ncbi:MAG: hypothetical protein QOE38_2493, partial [Thermoleophilaceae bacterium]|nr:hypothetical protein [Thermoleophilaceae bacterium]